MPHLLTSIRLSAVPLALALSLPAPALAQPKQDDAAKKTPADKTAPAQPNTGGGPTAAQLANAKEHFAKGKKLFDKKKYEEAVIEFKLAYGLTQNPLLALNIATTYDKLGNGS